MFPRRHLRLAVTLLAVTIVGIVSAACAGEEPGQDEGIAETSDAIHSREVVRGYKLPFRAGVTYSIVQYPHGYRDQIWNAVDVGIPRGDDVLAMKAGKVSAVIDTFPDYAPGYVCNWASCNDVTNFVIIQHDDGQESSYLHLARKSVSALGIAPGTRVCQGQVIGKVGHNGYSFGPHTHVSVQAGGSAGNRAQAWNAMWSKPTKVIQFDEAKGELVEGHTYKSQNGKACGGPPTPPSSSGSSSGASTSGAKDTKDAGGTDGSATDASPTDTDADLDVDAGEWKNTSGTLQSDPEASEGPATRTGVRSNREMQANAGCSTSPEGDASGAAFLGVIATLFVRSRRRRSARAGDLPDTA